MRGDSSRPSGRFNRPGQDALYLSQNVESARAALGRYVKEDDPPRVAVEYEIERCNVFDLRHPDAFELLTASRRNWQEALTQKRIPDSWNVADKIRAEGYVGLIDPSRQNPEYWHLVLFNWNEPHAPNVEQLNNEIPVQMG